MNRLDGKDKETTLALLAERLKKRLARRESARKAANARWKRVTGRG